MCQSLGVYCGGFCLRQICDNTRAALNYHRDQKGDGCAENFFKLLVFSFLFSSYRKKPHKFKPVQAGAHLSCLMMLSGTEEHTSSSDGLIAFC